MCKSEGEMAAERAAIAAEQAHGVKLWLDMMGDDVEVHSASVLESYLEQYDLDEVLFIEAVVVYENGTFKELWSSDLSDCEDWMCNESWPARLANVALL